MYATIIQKLHLGSIVGTHEHHVEYAKEGLKRLDILKRSFDGLTGELRNKTA